MLYLCSPDLVSCLENFFVIIWPGASVAGSPIKLIGAPSWGDPCAPPGLGAASQEMAAAVISVAGDIACTSAAAVIIQSWGCFTPPMVGRAAAAISQPWRHTMHPQQLGDLLWCSPTTGRLQELRGLPATGTCFLLVQR